MRLSQHALHGVAQGMCTIIAGCNYADSHVDVLCLLERFFNVKDGKFHPARSIFGDKDSERRAECPQIAQRICRAMPEPPPVASGRCENLQGVLKILQALQNFLQGV